MSCRDQQSKLNFLVFSLQMNSCKFCENIIRYNTMLFSPRRADAVCVHGAVTISHIYICIVGQYTKFNYMYVLHAPFVIENFVFTELKS